MSDHADAVAAAIEASRRLTVLRVLADVSAEHRLRLQILRLLAHLPGYAANTSELDTGLAACGLRVSRQTVRAAGAWLAEHALVKREDIGPVDVLTATRLGLDTAEGTAVITGVASPTTGAWIQGALVRWGIRASIDQVEAWTRDLAEHRLVMVDDQVAITVRGEDVAAGRLHVAGIAIPSPQE